MYKNIIISWSIEFGPIIVFFGTLSFLGDTNKGFIASTTIFSILTMVALIASYLYEKRIAWFPLIAGVSVITFGILTLVFEEPALFILKDTLYNGFFGVFLLGGVYMRKGLLKKLFVALFDMSDKGWHILSLRWGIFFIREQYPVASAQGSLFMYHIFTLQFCKFVVLITRIPYSLHNIFYN